MLVKSTLVVCTIFLVTKGIIFMGCSQKYVLNKKSSGRLVKHLIRESTGKKTEITTVDGKKIMVGNIQVVNDTVLAEDLDYYKIFRLGFDEIHGIEIEGHSGVGQGIAIGSLIGLSIGLAAEGSDSYFSPIGTILSAALFGTLGGIIGTTSRNGTQYIFNFSNREPAPKYFLLKGVQILDETESSIQVKWQDKLIWIEKSRITILKQDDQVSLRVPNEIYRQKFAR
jgi:hypothetical protein